MIKDFCAKEGNEYYVPNFGLNAINISFFLNHSPTPNIITLDDGNSFITAQMIPAGEELTVNYSSFSEGHSFKHKEGNYSPPPKQ